MYRQVTACKQKCIVISCMQRQSSLFICLPLQLCFVPCSLHNRQGDIQLSGVNVANLSRCAVERLALYTTPCLSCLLRHSQSNGHAARQPHPTLESCVPCNHQRLATCPDLSGPLAVNYWAMCSGYWTVREGAAQDG